MHDFIHFECRFFSLQTFEEKNLSFKSEIISFHSKREKKAICSVALTKTIYVNFIAHDLQGI